MRNVTIIVAGSLLLCLAVGALAAAMPEAAACALLAAGAQVERPGTAQDRAETAVLLAAARERIATTFGPPRAAPTVAFMYNADAFWPLPLNATASTTLIGNRACVIVGPKGQSVDVLAHELMHAELAERVGYWRRMTQVPTWFDEGVAMQVDFRPRYDLPQSAAAPNGEVRTLATAGAFFEGDGDQRARNYAAAKYEVARWLSGVGRPGLYRQLERLRNGEPFAAVLAD